MKERYRLVAYILPETNWIGDQLDESEIPVIAREDLQHDKGYCVVVKEVGPPSGEPDGCMVFLNDLYFPQGTVVEWMELRDKIDHALSKPVMHRNDFTHIFET